MKTPSSPVTFMFKNRRDAGCHLAETLWAFLEDQEDVVILALPRGGVPVAAEIAKFLGKPFDLLVVRKLGIPGHEEVAMGAIASGGVQILDQELISRLNINREDVETVVQKEIRELARREAQYRGSRKAPSVMGRTVILVDDGIATGSSMSAAIQLIREQEPERILVAVPVAPQDTVRRLREEADEVVVVLEPDPFVAVGQCYQDFSQTTDEEVQVLLAEENPPPDSRLGKVPLFVPDKTALRRIRQHAKPLTGTPGDFDGLLKLIGDSSVVLIGEASHGTHEFYRVRAQITKRLIEEAGFTAVAVEADWPDAYRVNRFVRGESADPDSADALAGFERFPAWMWRNADVVDFVGWLRNHNEHVHSPDHQVGFYGLDLYSLHKSINEVLTYLEAKDPAEAAKARILYGCINRFGPDPQNYGLMAGSGISESCRAEVIQQLTDLRAKEAEYLARDGAAAIDAFFFAAQNARLVKNAEEYYRQMFRSDVSSWNLRDKHMMETLVELMAHLQSHTGSAKVVVWAHNSHLGDARATQMSRRGEWNIGQLVRQAFPYQSKLIGFTTYTGTVTAASGWHLPAERKRVQPGLPGSYERLFHQVGIPNFWLDLTEDNAAATVLREPRIERAIGVIYRPETELASHYFEACLADQFDAVLHYDQTRAVEPLERSAEWSREEAPETFPAGL
jgi:erythromycin esterase-like protein/predicted phosphoribosyltransferase